jgi:hypothetical protein
MQFLTVENVEELIKEFKGYTLIKKGYQSTYEMNYFIGDLIELENLLYALGEIDSHESSFTLKGKDFFNKLIERSNMKDLVKTNTFADFFSDIERFIDFPSVKNTKKESERIFCPLINQRYIKKIEKFYRINLNTLYPNSLRQYDVSFSLILKIYGEIYHQDKVTPLRSFKIRYISKELQRTFCLYLNKEKEKLIFKPVLYTQSLKEKGNVFLRNDRLTKKYIFKEFNRIEFDVCEKKIKEKVRSFLVKLDKITKEIINELECDNKPEDIIALQCEIIKPGALWDDIRLSKV